MFAQITDFQMWAASQEYLFCITGRLRIHMCEILIGSRVSGLDLFTQNPYHPRKLILSGENSGTWYEVDTRTNTRHRLSVLEVERKCKDIEIKELLGKEVERMRKQTK